MATTIHTLEHDWRPVSADGDWDLPEVLAASFGMVVNQGETARVTKYCPACDLYQARVFTPAGESQLGLRANALIHGLDLFGR